MPLWPDSRPSPSASSLQPARPIRPLPPAPGVFPEHGPARAPQPVQQGIGTRVKGQRVPRTPGPGEYQGGHLHENEVLDEGSRSGVFCQQRLKKSRRKSNSLAREGRRRSSWRALECGQGCRPPAALLAGLQLRAEPPAYAPPPRSTAPASPVFK